MGNSEKAIQKNRITHTSNEFAVNEYLLMT